MVQNQQQELKSYQLKLQATQFLRATGILDAYENVVEELVTKGWPSDKTIFDHAAHELLKWHTEHKEEYAHNSMGNVNPGAAGLQNAMQR